MDVGLRGIELLHPHAAQNVDGRHLTQPGRCIPTIESTYQVEAVGPHDLGQRLALAIGRGEAIGVDARAIAVKPVRRYLSAQPVGSHHGETVQRLAQGFPDALQPVEPMDGGEHMGGIRALLAPWLEQALVSE